LRWVLRFGSLARGQQPHFVVGGNTLTVINIKLDKTGGLTHALELVHAARELGLGLVVGSMTGSSLAVAPAFVIGCLVDLGARLFAIALTAAFAVALWISLNYHLIGITGEY
jgi:L-alanine-DL-glutamate epimerase-like enolase superfamily enzyme